MKQQPKTPKASGAPADPAQILEARARALARPLAHERAAGADSLRLLAFSLGGERYAVELRYALEVFRLSTFSPLPGAPAPIFGLTAWRGEIVTLVDLRRMLGLPSQRLDDLRIALVLGEPSAPLAVLADAVDDVVDLDPRTLAAAVDGAAASREYIRGVTPDAVLVLDAARLLERHAQEG